MAKKSASKQTQAKGKPSKPPKPRKTGGGGDDAKPVNEDVMGSEGGKKFVMPTGEARVAWIADNKKKAEQRWAEKVQKWRTAKAKGEAVDWGCAKFHPLGDAAEYEAIRRQKLEERALFNEKCRAMERAFGSTMTPDEIAADDEELHAIDLAMSEKEAFEEQLLNRVWRGELFGDDRMALVKTVVERIKGELAMQTIEGGASQAEYDLAQLLSLVLSSRSVKAKDVWPWVAKTLNSRGFMYEWAWLKRKSSKGHNRVMFEFCLSKLAYLDDFVSSLAAESGLSTARTDTEHFAARAKAIEQTLNVSPGMWEFLSPVLTRFFNEWELGPDFIQGWGGAWNQWKQHHPLECVDAVMPYIMEEWAALQRQDKRRLERIFTEPANVRRAIRNCVETIYLELQPCDPDSKALTKGHQQLLIEKHTFEPRPADESRS